jgi:Fic-DOC domain mobile mystery protein B
VTFEFPPASTPIDTDAATGLIPSLTTQRELNEFEAMNILDAVKWAHRTRPSSTNLLNASAILAIHKKMFGKTWKWAGTLRQRETSIGVDPRRIQSDLKILLDDMTYWLKHGTYSIEECAIRFHHRLVKIHVFPNGNGRHARLLCDLSLKANNRKPIVWPADLQGQNSTERTRYLAALKAADNDDYTPLLTLIS